MGFVHMFFSAIVMLLLLSLLIIIHELGHFLAAKAVGIRVDKFGFGLPVGPTLFSKKFGETEILIHAFLLGGYVSFPDDEEDCDLPMDSPRRYSNKTVGQRSIVISAGVICNVIIAYVIVFFTGIVWHHLPENTFTVRFQEFAPQANEAIVNSGLQKDDIIYSINGTKIDYPIAIGKYAKFSKEFDGFVNEKTVQEKLVELKKLNPKYSEDTKVPAGSVIKLPTFTDEEKVELTFDHIIGLEKYVPAEIALTQEQARLRDDINYQTTYKLQKDETLYNIANAISDTKKPMNLVVIRNNEKVELPTIYSSSQGLLGIKQTYSENYVEIKNFKGLLAQTNHYICYNMGFMVYTLGKLFTGKVPMSEMNGIIAITKIGTEIIAYKGLFQGLLLTAMISLNLALINILPVPALDGGHLFFLIIEKITGKPVSKKFVEILSNFFFYLLVLLMIYVIFNDIYAWIIGKI